MNDPMDINEFLSRVRHNDFWRKGQAAFNIAYEMWPEVANKARGSLFDPFNNDSKLDDFLLFLIDAGCLS
jgi:hypothetical protein